MSTAKGDTEAAVPARHRCFVDASVAHIIVVAQAQAERQSRAQLQAIDCIQPRCGSEGAQQASAGALQIGRYLLLYFVWPVQHQSHTVVAPDGDCYAYPVIEQFDVDVGQLPYKRGVVIQIG